MNINPSMGSAQPNFQAKFKDNKNYRELTDKMCNSYYQSFKKMENILDRFSKDDVLEIYTKKDETAENGKIYGVRNPKKKGANFEFNKAWDSPSEQLHSLVKNLITPNHKNSEKLLTEPATKDPRHFGEKWNDFWKDFWEGDSFDRPCR